MRQWRASARARSPHLKLENRRIHLNVSHMKTSDDELREMTDMVIKLIWTQTVFLKLFDKNDTDTEVRLAHPELFLTLHDSLIWACSEKTDSKSGAFS